MLKYFFSGFVGILLLTACGAQQQPPAADPAKDGKHFGAMITPENALPYESAFDKLASVDSLPMKLTGKVSEVCQKKGCWMTLVSEQGKPEMRVTFKDYAFFMPLDLAGKRVVVDGYAYVEMTPVDVLRHYAEDAGKSKEEIAAITEPKREVSFEAAGVVILD
jgi:Domain of unknown function (DUF4920)